MVKYCRECGAKNEDDAVFCRKCGIQLMKIQKVESDKSEENTPKENFLQKHWKKVLIIIIILAIISVAGFFTYNSLNVKTYSGDTWTANYPTDSQPIKDEIGQTVSFYTIKSPKTLATFGQAGFNATSLSEFTSNINEEYTIYSAEEVTFDGQKAYKVQGLDTSVTGGENLTYYYFPSKDFIIIQYNDQPGSQILINSFKFK